MEIKKVKDKEGNESLLLSSFGEKDKAYLYWALRTSALALKLSDGFADSDSIQEGKGNFLSRKDYLAWEEKISHKLNRIILD